MSDDPERELAIGLAMLRADMVNRRKPEDEINMIIAVTKMIGRVQIDIGRIAKAVEVIARKMEGTQ